MAKTSKSKLQGWKPEAETARQLGKSIRTLRLWRRRGIGPAYSKIGNKVVYRAGAIPEFLAAAEVQPVRSRAA